MAGGEPDLGTDLFAGRYRLREVLGRGGMADVYRADDQVLGRSVAVKIFRHGQPLSAPRIDAETRTLAALSHPGLVTLFDAGTASGGPYLVMEFVDGHTLGTFRSGHALRPAAVARIGHELAQALAYIHSRGVVHRDIKPANILLGGSPAAPTVKLADFGIARIVDAERLTEHGTSVGTAHYVSPEQATGVTAGPPSDVYSLGLVLIECLVGRMVFEGSAVAAAVARLHHDPVVPVEFGSQWSSLLTDMTSRRPQDRPSAADVASRLRMVDTGSPSATAVMKIPADVPAVVPFERDDGRRPTRAWVLPIAAVAALLLALALGWSAFESDESPVLEPAGPSTSEILPAQTTAQATVESAPESVSLAPVVVPAPVVPLSPEPVPVETANPNSGAPGNSGNGNNGNGNGGNGNGGNGNGGNGNGSNGNGNGNNGNGNRN
ncbi:serine/threonine-protein kinase [Rhodococcus sovatensis]|uniref:non-specific serine/threonine protein kinase n=1 Tax=Rhodococcus sovatensis TaxID=1805840 RepID=A0ABZ2PH87_9NOCA